jgi:hypothetical protein
MDAEDLGLYLVAGTRKRILHDLNSRQASAFMLRSSLRALHTSRECIARSDRLIAKLWT